MVIKDLFQIGKTKNPRNAGFLLMHAAKISKTELLIGELEVSNHIEEKYYEFLQRASNGEPVEYITNSAEFFGRIFYVNNSVLIPRDETELLVETTIAELKTIKKPVILDIGTGSGCIAISLALAIPTAKIFATDISLPALEVAKRNALNLGVSNRIEFLHNDITTELPVFDDTIDLLISNPPYISIGDKMIEPAVHNFEPHTALYANENGLEVYRHIAEKASGIAKIIALEVGYSQANDVAELLQKNGFSDIKTIPDYAGIDRIVIAKYV